MKKTLALVFALMLLLAACGGGGSPSQPSSSVPDASSSLPDSSAAPIEPITMRIAGLKGPTTMGMVKLMSDADEGLAVHDYQVEMYGTADEIVPKLVAGEIDIAAVPANLASVLYNNTDGAVQVAAINTLGVLYVVETGDTIQSIEDLRGRTIYSTGKGTTPEFALNYILAQNGLENDVSIEYKSESTEIAALLAAGEDAVAVLPQPYVTAVQMQNENVRVALSLSDEWDNVSDGSGMVTGVLLVRTAFLEEHGDAFAQGFLPDYEASINWVNANTADAAALVAQYGIVEKAPVAEKALPACNIVYIAGADMRTKLEGYLEVLYAQNPASVGGALPADDFYYAAA